MGTTWKLLMKMRAGSSLRGFFKKKWFTPGIRLQNVSTNHHSEFMRISSPYDQQDDFDDFGGCTYHLDELIVRITHPIQITVNFVSQFPCCFHAAKTVRVSPGSFRIQQFTQNTLPTWILYIDEFQAFLGSWDQLQVDTHTTDIAFFCSIQKISKWVQLDFGKHELKSPEMCHDRFWPQDIGCCLHTGVMFAFGESGFAR